MDVVQGKSPPPMPFLRTNRRPDWAAYLMGNHGMLWAYSSYGRQLYTLLNTAKSYILPLIDQVSKKPDLATIALLIVILFVSLKILNMLLQTVLFWLRLARTIAFWGGLGALGLWMYTRGPEGVWEDVQYWLKVWNQDYDYWKEKERVTRMARQRGGQGYTGWY